MLLLLMLSLALLGPLLYVVKWTLSPPNGVVDGVLRILICTAAGAIFACWITVASAAPELNRQARMSGVAMLVPRPEQARFLYDRVFVAAPVAVKAAGAIGAITGVVIALASAGSYRRSPEPDGRHSR